MMKMPSLHAYDIAVNTVELNNVIMQLWKQC